MSNRFVIMSDMEAYEAGVHDDDGPVEKPRYSWSEYQYLVDTQAVPPVVVGYGGGEPEDASLYRSYNWILGLVNSLQDEIDRLREERRDE